MISANAREHFRDTLRLSLPVIAGQLGNVFISIGDNLMVGNLGTTEMASAGLAGSIFFLVFIFSIGMTLAITPLTGESFGAKNEGDCKEIFRNGLYINLLTGIILTIACIFSIHLIDYLNQPDEVRLGAKGFLFILSISIFPATLFMHFKQYIEGFGRVLPGMVIMGMMVAVNIFANWLLIYGKWGLPEMGLNGAATATLFARILGMFSIIGWVLFDPYLREKIRIPLIRVPDRAVVKRILSVGVPSSMQYFFEIGAFSGALIMVGWIGKKEIAAHNVAIHLASVTFLIASGISSAATIRVSQAKGEGDLGKARTAGFSAIVMGALFMCFSACVFWLGQKLLPALYLAEKEVVELAAVLMSIAAFFQVFDGIQAISVGALRGLSDAKVPALITFVAYWVIGLPGGYVLGFMLDMGMKGIWYALSLSLAFSAVFLSLRFHRLTKRLVNQTDAAQE